jgi:hypothetical protein
VALITYTLDRPKLQEDYTKLAQRGIVFGLCGATDKLYNTSVLIKGTI